MQLSLLFLIITFLLISNSMSSPALAYYDGQISVSVDGHKYVFKDLPKFEDFPAEKKANKHIAKDINWSSDKNAWSLRTRLRQGLKIGENFNGHYAVVAIGCGSPCQTDTIIDVNNGNVIGSVGGPFGASFEYNSSLIITNLLDDADLQEAVEAGSIMVSEIDFYSVKNGKLRKIKTFEIYKEIEKQKAEAASRETP